MTEFWTPKILTSVLDFFSNINICEQLSMCSWLKPSKITQWLQVCTTVPPKRLDVAHIYYIFTDIFSDMLSFIFPVLTVDRKLFCIVSKDVCVWLLMLYFPKHVNECEVSFLITCKFLWKTHIKGIARIYRTMVTLYNNRRYI